MAYIKTNERIMKYLFLSILFVIIKADDFGYKKSFYDYSAIGIEGDSINMEKFKGKNILLVNVASKCGYTPQYLELQQLHEDYKNNLVVLGFPSNDFLWQEPGSNDEIKTFCRREYGVTFQMFQKIHVKGKHTHDIYKWLSNSDQNGWNDKAPTWNFCKYLIDEEGSLIEFYNAKIEPTDSVLTKHLILNQKF